MQDTIRRLERSKAYLLKEFTYQAIFQRDKNDPIPRSVLEHPEIKVFYEDFGKPDDLCLALVVDERIVGAVWTRVLSGDVKGFGNVDGITPEFAISIFLEYRGIGFGTKMMENMLSLLRDKGYAKTSLAVQKDNYAVKMYGKVGFHIVRETDQEYIMVCNLS